MEKIKIRFQGEYKEYPKGTTLYEISQDFKERYNSDIILAYINGRLGELHKTIDSDCEINFVTTKDDAGNKTYKRGVTLVMLRAVHDVIGRENYEKVQVEYAIGKGLFCEIKSEIKLNEELLQKIKLQMIKIVEEDVEINKEVVSTEEAINLFDKYQMYDKKRLFKYRRMSNTNIYRIGGFRDYFYGYMPNRTGMLKYFELCLYDTGFMLIMPNKEDPTDCTGFVPQDKLFLTMKESNAWGVMLKLDTVADLNDEITYGNVNDLILVQEALQERKIGEIAVKIKEAGNKKFIMIAGPSSSGKTTFSHRLSIQLRANGLNPHPIAIDNYFVDREKTPLDEFGKYNFEILEAIDIEQFNKDMTDLLDGKTVEIPDFNFKTGKREYKGNFKTLGKDDILVIEGIHGLNDKLSYALPKESKFKIYISALTQLNVDEHNRIPTTDGRLIRRMIRDARTRGTKAQDTIAMWASVRRGEDSNIFPFQEEADVMFNSALIYELSVLKQYAEPLLFGIDKDKPEYIEAKRLLKFLDYFLPVSSEEIPRNSILREFIGGSYFKV